LTFLPGETVGSALPWPAWTHAVADDLDTALADLDEIR
jgi:hypothetical protein